MTTSRQRLGRRGEEVAQRLLKEKGYSIIQANYRAKAGEIDVVAEKDGVLAFVEVRTRRGPDFGTPEESLTREKRRHMIDAAQEYLQHTASEGREWRIDLVAIELDRRGRLLRAELLENAVET